MKEERSFQGKRLHSFNLRDIRFIPNQLLITFVFIFVRLLNPRKSASI